MDYIDEMYRQMTQGRYPANAAFDQVLRTGKPAPSGTPLVNPPTTVNGQAVSAIPQIQEPIVISGDRPELIEYPPGYKVQVPQSEIIRQNTNQAYGSQVQNAENLAAAADELYSERTNQKSQMQEALKRMMETTSQSFSDPSSDEAIKSYRSQILSAPQIPERDMATELILNLGPALGGMFLGESGKLAAPVALKGARDLYEGQRKQDIDNLKLQREETEKRLKAAIEARKSGQESFDKSQQRQLDRDKAILSGLGDVSKMTASELKDVEQNLVNINKDVSQAVSKGALDIAKMERSKELESNKNKRTARVGNDLELKNATDLRKEFNARPEVKRFSDVSVAFDKVQKAEKNPSAAGDLSLIFGYMKMLDPGSTVREGEFANAQNAAGVPDQIVNLYNKLRSGERLNPEQRKQFISSAKDAYDAELDSRKRVESEFSDISSRYKVDPKLIFTPAKEVSINQFPKTVTKGNQKATVSNEKELKEAMSEGWK